jgi:hypothetical protein
MFRRLAAELKDVGDQSPVREFASAFPDFCARGCS